MSDKKITYNDLMAYESLFTIAPSFLLGRYIKKNTNLVKKFSSQIKSQLKNLDSKQQEQLNIVLSSDINDLQQLMLKAYKNTNKKQFKLLAQPNAGEFIRLNLSEIKKLMK